MHTNDMTNPDRRRWLRAAGLLLGGGAALRLAPLAAATRLRPTPVQGAGPFYPAAFPPDSDHDLAQVAGHDGVASGELTELAGRVTDLQGRALAGARLEIWQCNAFGRYHHPRDAQRVPLDPGFQGYGRAVADAAGHYRFRTIRPVAYPGRTPHIHFAVHAAGMERPLVTQMYVAGERSNAGDGLFRRIPDALRELVVVPFEPAGTGGIAWQARFDIVLDAGGRFG